MKNILLFLLFCVSTTVDGQIQKIEFPDSTLNGTIGRSLLFVNEELMVPCATCDIGTGRVFTYAENENTWELKQTIESPTGSLSFFGVALTNNQDHLFVGATQEFDQGEVYYYRKLNDSWDLAGTIVAPRDDKDIDDFGLNIVANDSFLFVQSFYYENQTNGGRLFVYRKVGDEYIYDQTINPPDTTVTSYFGSSLDLENNILVVGDIQHRNTASGRGAAFIYKYQNNIWEFTKKITATDLAQFDDFADEVNIENNIITIGSTEALNDAGAVYIYGQLGDDWVLQQKLTEGTAGQGDSFGGAIGRNDDVMLVRSKWNEQLQQLSGSVDMFEYQDDEWVKIGLLLPDSLPNEAGYGNSMSFYHSIVAVGASLEGEDGQFGAVYLFDLENLVDIEQVNLEYGLTKIFPNPATNGDQIIIDAHEKFTSYSIFSIEGKELVSPRAFNGRHINLTGLTTGRYILNLTNQETIATTVLLVK